MRRVFSLICASVPVCARAPRGGGERPSARYFYFLCMHMTTWHESELPPGWGRYPYTVGGYRVRQSWAAATRSVFDARHNEFWMIWTDVLPLVAFVGLFVVNIQSLRDREPFQQTLVAGVYAAVIISRLCSLFYHVYNVVSLRLNQTLVFVDRIGICCMAFGSPWAFACANGTRSFRDGAFFTYLCVLFAVFWLNVVLLAARVAGAEAFCVPPPVALLVALAVVGNYPAVQVCLDGGAGGTLRALFACGALSFAVGYGVFLQARVPERWLRSGAADGKLWHGHVLWHVAASGGQLAYVLSTFL